MSEAIQFGIIVSGGVAFYAVLRIPHWLFASMNRGTLWRLRDFTFDARRSGCLPDSEVVERFLRLVEGMIVVLPSTTALQFWWYDRRGMTRAHDSEPVRLKLPDASPSQSEYFEVLQDELERIVLRHYLLCSWSGLLFKAPRHRQAVRSVLQRRHEIDHWNRIDETGPRSEAWDAPELIRYQEIAQQVTHAVEEQLSHGDCDSRDNDLIAAAG